MHTSSDLLRKEDAGGQRAPAEPSVAAAAGQGPAIAVLQVLALQMWRL